MSYTPVFNGMDYLDSAVEHLTAHTPPTSHDLKYAVLHLQAAVEVLLKARLVREHWSLVFKEPGSATRARFDKGEFESCNITAAIDRLRDIAAVPISDDEKKAIRALATTRNALTHYGHTASAYAVEGSAVGVLHFLLTFVPDHLEPALSSEAAVVQTKLEALRHKLRHVEGLVKLRMRALANELDHVENRTVACPGCAQWALVVAETPVVCRFCRRTYELAGQAADEYAWVTRRTHDYAPLVDCPSCLVRGTLVVARTAHVQHSPAYLCFACGFTYDPEEMAGLSARQRLLNRYSEAMEAGIPFDEHRFRHADGPEPHTAEDCTPTCPHWGGVHERSTGADG
ncbi:hypothetical protein ACFO9E_25415 [Streptomyces maoxianensis]|uniref:Uncharacterized protein n=1 Tax=Streptomyces maoxianensis TaxID=1459942 RepID=A0ABV9GAN7_9ACTN